VWLIALGAWLATNLGAADALVGLQTAGDTVLGGLGLLLAVLAVLALVATMGINAYSLMLSTLTLIDCVRPIQPSRQLRVVTIIVLAVLWMVAAIAVGGDAVGALFNSLTVMLFLLIPWTAINLVDYFFVRRGRYAITDLFSPTGIYGTWSARGLIAFAIGLLSMVPFINVLGWYKGPAVDALGGADISSIVGLLVSATVYYVLSRSLHLADEDAAIAISERTLAETMP
jgi:purine-cytosine permease-like protein